jgi:hypothetical protein
MSDPGATSTIRLLAGRALVAGLCVAAAVALLALLSGSLDDTDWKIVATSLGFSVFSSTAAAGGSLRLRPAAWAQAVGLATLAVSALAFVLLGAALWADEGGDALVRGWGVAALLALWGSHAAVVLRPLRPSDSMAIRSLSAASIAALGLDTWIGVLAILDAFGDTMSDPVQRVLAALIVLTLLTSALVAILRRTAPKPRPTARAAPAPAEVAFGIAASRTPATDLSVEIAAVAASLEALPPSPELRSAAARLRQLAEHAAAG